MSAQPGHDVRWDVRRAAVIGAGVMGAGLAAHLANAGVEVLLLDIKPAAPSDDDAAKGWTRDTPAVADRPARAGLEAARRARPAAFMAPEFAARVRVGNVEDHLDQLADVDWVLEAIVERLDAKSQLYARLAPHLGPTTLLTSNTSGLSCAELSAALPPELARRFAVTHFFNPPRYLELVELVPGPGADPAAMAGLTWFLERRLGKGVVHAKDTPDFIANRIGMHGLMHALAVLERGDFHVATLDALTGTLIGRPASATFRTADLVGLDTLGHVADNLHTRLTHDPARAMFARPALLDTLIGRGLLGAKSGAGFYRKTSAGLEQIDPQSMDYVPVVPPELDLPRGPLGARLAMLLFREDAVGAFLREHLGGLLTYAAACVPEVADSLPDVDRALRWGFGWKLGPFELWDTLGEALGGGVAAVEAALAADGRTTPPLVRQLLERGESRFYAGPGDAPDVLVPGGGRSALAPRPRVLEPARIVAAGGRIAGCDDADLIDLGQDVAGLRFRTKAGVLTPELGAFVVSAFERVEHDHAALVILGQDEHFSAGANLNMLLAASIAGRFDEVEALVASFQQLNLALAACRRPVVLAPHGRTFGGACEMLMHAHGAVAAAESYIGLVEVGAGLIPAGGGCKEWLVRVQATLPADVEADRLPLLMRALQTMAQGRVSTSAAEARALGYLGPDDPIVMNRAHLWHDAALHARALAERDTPPTPRGDLAVMGRDGLAALRVGVFNLVEGRRMSAHDARVTLAIAGVLCGGDGPDRRCSEQELLDLEREAFVSLCGEPATQARMAHLLKTGKALRN